MKIALLLRALGVLILGIAVVVWKSSRFGYESPEYSVVEKDGAFEIRDYPAMTLVSTGMDSPNPGEGGSFMRLFRYITLRQTSLSGQGLQLAAISPGNVRL